jgi:hypothetical protein
LFFRGTFSKARSSLLRRIQIHKGDYMKKTYALIVVLGLILTTAVSRPVLAMEKGVMSIVGPIVGVPVGGIMGLVRGAESKGVEYADTFSKKMGDDLLGKLIGIPTGLIVGHVAGGITGLAKGVVDGVVIGIDDPLSTESASLSGEFLDFEPYKILESTK